MVIIGQSWLKRKPMHCVAMLTKLNKFGLLVNQCATLTQLPACSAALCCIWAQMPARCLRWKVLDLVCLFVVLFVCQPNVQLWPSCMLLCIVLHLSLDACQMLALKSPRPGLFVCLLVNQFAALTHLPAPQRCVAFELRCLRDACWKALYIVCLFVCCFVVLFVGQPMCSFDPVACSSMLHCTAVQYREARGEIRNGRFTALKLKYTADYKMKYTHSSKLHWHIILHYTPLHWKVLKSIENTLKQIWTVPWKAPIALKSSEQQ